MLLNFCHNYVQYTDRKVAYKPLRLILTRQILKIQGLIGKLHEDLQFDFVEAYDALLVEAEKKFPWFYKAEYEL